LDFCEHKKLDPKLSSKSVAFLDTGLLTDAIGDNETNDAGGYQSLHRFRNKEVSRMKLAVVITMILAIIAPVVAQTSKFKLYECIVCHSQRQSQFRPPTSAGKGGCVGSGGQRFDFHNWQEVR